jgi:hypothetical protein
MLINGEETFVSLFALSFLWPYLPFPDLWYIFNYRFFAESSVGKENLTNLVSCRRLCGDRQPLYLFHNTSCPTVKSVARPVQIRQKMATHSPTLTSGMRRRASLLNIRKKFNVSSLSLVGNLFVFLRSHEHVLVGLITNSLAERRAQEQLTPVYQQRREALKSITKFWPVALLKHSLFALQAQHDADRLALSYLEDVWVVRDPREPKVFTLEFVRLLL